MINPITKGIVALATAMGYGTENDYKGTSAAEVLSEVFSKMGYGKKSDYKVSTVTDVLYDAAKIAKDKGGPGGGANVVFGKLIISGTSGSIEGVNFEEAKTVFLSNGKVLILYEDEERSLYIPVTEYDGESNTLVFKFEGEAHWHSDNSVTNK